MYTMECKDPSCIKCKRTSKGQSSEEEVRSEILKRVEQLISIDLLSVSKEKAICLETFRKLKDEVRYKISGLVDILKERERDLCILLEQEYIIQTSKIDQDVTVRSYDKLINSEDEKTPCRMQLIFHSDFDDLEKKLQNFGSLSYEHVSGILLKGQEIDTKLEEPKKIKAQNTRPALCLDDQFEVHFETACSTEKCLPTDFASPSIACPSEKNREKFNMLGKHCDEEKCPEPAEPKSKNFFEDSSDEEDIEFISRDEFDCTPPIVPFTPKKRFTFFKKRSFFNSVLPKKVDTNPLLSSDKDERFERAGVSENRCSNVSKRSSISLGNSTEKKEKAINQAEQESFCGHLSGSMDMDPTAALMSSFVKYLEKTPDSEWLAPTRNSEQFLSSGNSCIFRKPLSFIVEKDNSLSEWLSKKDRAETNSDWLLRD